MHREGKKKELDSIPSSIHSHNITLYHLSLIAYSLWYFHSQITSLIFFITSIVINISIFIYVWFTLKHIWSPITMLLMKCIIDSIDAFLMCELPLSNTCCVCFVSLSFIKSSQQFVLTCTLNKKRKFTRMLIMKDLSYILS